MNVSKKKILIALCIMISTPITVALAGKCDDDCNRKYPKSWQFPDRQRCFIEKKAACLVAEAWGEGGRVAYQGAAATMKKRSPRGESLHSKVKRVLRGNFGSTVDKVRVHWGTPGLDEWATNKYGIDLTGSESAAQTYGYNIYIQQRKPSNCYRNRNGVKSALDPCC